MASKPLTSSSTQRMQYPSLMLHHLDKSDERLNTRPEFSGRYHKADIVSVRDARGFSIWRAEDAILPLIRRYPESLRSDLPKRFLDNGSALQLEEWATNFESHGCTHFPKHSRCRLLRDYARSPWVQVA